MHCFLYCFYFFFCFSPHLTEGESFGFILLSFDFDLAPRNILVQVLSLTSTAHPPGQGRWPRPFCAFNSRIVITGVIEASAVSASLRLSAVCWRPPLSFVAGRLSCLCLYLFSFPFWIWLFCTLLRRYFEWPRSVVNALAMPRFVTSNRTSWPRFHLGMSVAREHVGHAPIESVCRPRAN